MQFFRSLFALRHKYRNFALVDHKGVCVAFKQCRLPPQNGRWVEVEEFRLNWLQHPLPSSARIPPKPVAHKLTEN